MRTAPSFAQPATLLERFLPKSGILWDGTLGLSFSLLLALSAQLHIPIPGSPVPITAQTFALLLGSAILGRKKSLWGVGFYLLEGGLGLPVFSPLGTPGWLRFLGPTGGYLLGFAAAAYVVGSLAERGWDRAFPSCALMMLLGNLCILGLGLLGLSRHVPAYQLLRLGLYPFLLGDLVKLSSAILALPSTWKFLGQNSR